MTQLFKFTSTREPNLTLNSNANTKSWTLRPSTQLSSGKPALKTGTPNPASLLLPDKLIEKIESLRDFRLGDATHSHASSSANQRSMGFGIPKFDALYHRLHEQYLSKNCDALEEIASSHLRSFPPKKLTDLSELQQRIYLYFSEKGCSATQEEHINFFRSISLDDLIEYVNDLFEFFDVLKCEILSAQILGLLGHTGYNLIQMLNANLAFFVLGSVAYKADVEAKEIPIKYICLIMEMRVFLPDWTFDIDPCKWKGDGGKNSKPGKSPLAQRIEVITAYKTAIQEQTSHADSDGGELRFAEERKSEKKRHPHPDCQATESDDSYNPCDCSADCKPVCFPPDPCCAEINYYVTDLMVLREETTCYKPSDLAYIENVAPFETRVRKHGFVKTVEDFTEEETTTSRSEERDHQVTDRFNLQKAIENEISTSVDVEAEFGGGSYSIKTNSSLSMDSAQKEARETFREAVNKATLTMQSKTRKLRSRRVTTEETESNKHKFKNETPLPAVTKYFWVTQGKSGQVFSHGLRGMVELLIPSPAMLYEHLEKIKAERAFDFKKPKHPCIRLEEILPGEYNNYVVEYDLLDLPKPPVRPPVLFININASFKDGSIPIIVPDGYEATFMEITQSKLSKKAFRKFARMSFIFGGGALHNTTKNDTTTASISARGISTASIQWVSAKDTTTMSVRVTLTPDPVDISEWQLTVFKSIMEKYQEELRKYEEAVADHNRRQEDGRIEGKHPFVLNEIVRAEIMRAAIYMMCDEFDRDGVMNMKSEPCGYPEINRRNAADKTWDWYFFDRAFDWRLMSYKFFDYFRNPKCTWPDKFDPGDPNFMFNAFLRAGYCRVQVPISPAMDQDVIWYLKTKQKWGSGGTIPVDPSDTRWVSVIEEIKHSYDVYQNDREGVITSIVNASNNNANTSQVLITGSDRYWDILGATVDQNAINLDLNREIYIDGIAYCITDIKLDPSSPPFSPTAGSDMQWIVSLNRLFEGEAFADPTIGVLKQYNYAIGAKYIGAPFLFELPTNLIWVGDHENKCLPCYPIECESD